MRKLITIPLSLAIIAVIGMLCFSTFAIGIMLRTLHVFTKETVVAEVIMHPIQQDERGEFIIIEFTPYIEPDALTEVIKPDNSDVVKYGETKEYKIYGDTVAIRGPFIKLYDSLLLLNYNNTYKLALIEGEYRKKDNQGQGEGTEIYINGGFDEKWWFLNNDEAVFPYSFVIDRFTFSGDEEPGYYGTGRKKYEIVVTHDTITWNLKGTFD